MIIKRGKKGVSPVIATVLLIVLVIVIALLIFVWAKRFVGEACEKGGTSTENKCQEVNLEASRVGTALYLNNKGNVAIGSIRIKISIGGSESVIDKGDDGKAISLASGQSREIEVSDMDGAETVTVIPILKGATKSAACEDVCEKIEIDAPEASG